MNEAANHCDGCGACCRTQALPPFHFADDNRWRDLVVMKPDLAREIIFDRVKFRDANDVPCTWLDLETMKCKHYDFRPDICRQFVVGDKYCNGWRDRFGLTPLTIGETK